MNYYAASVKGNVKSLGSMLSVLRYGWTTSSTILCMDTRTYVCTHIHDVIIIKIKARSGCGLRKTIYMHVYTYVHM